MCGIIGYCGPRDASKVILEGLKRLEYRGYDSAGMAIGNNEIKVEKSRGYVSSLKGNLRGHVGIGHTRWATHGEPSDRNAHPFTGCRGEFAIVHNGIIENYHGLKEELLANGHVFSSETDSEVFSHLLEDEYEKDGDFMKAFLRSISRLKGSFAILAIHRGEDRIFAAKQDSPLVVGRGNGENFIASDIPAFLNYTSEVAVLNDGDVCEINSSGISFYDMSGNRLDRAFTYVDWSPEAAEKAGYEHFMLKEIFEQPLAIENTIHSLFSTELEIRPYPKLDIVACGTSYNAGMVGKYFLESILHIPVDLHYASEYRSRPPVRERSLAIFITQSGETADTITAAKIAGKRGYETVAITNVIGSSITRHTERVIYTSAGPEIGVAATKTFTAQVLALYYLGLSMGRSSGALDERTYEELTDEVRRLPRIMESALESEEMAEAIAEILKDATSMFYIGRSINYPVAMEGALKMKEISYIHAEAYPAGELKHGPLALITRGTPVVAMVSRDETYEKMIGNIREVSARGARVIAISSVKDIEDYADYRIPVPETHPLFSPFVNTVAAQLLAYHTARKRGCEIDKPRNLAKSVTVE